MATIVQGVVAEAQGHHEASPAFQELARLKAVLQTSEAEHVAVSAQAEAFDRAVVKALGEGGDVESQETELVSLAGKRSLLADRIRRLQALVKEKTPAVNEALAEARRNALQEKVRESIRTIRDLAAPVAAAVEKEARKLMANYQEAVLLEYSLSAAAGP